MFIAGIDGGGSKTKCIIGDEKGNILAEGLGKGSNYHICGLEEAKQSILSSIDAAMSSIDIKRGDLDYIVLGLAGADSEKDINNLSGMCSSLFEPNTFKVVNDCWIGLRSALDNEYGIVSICGTGGACAGKNRGQEKILRNLDYKMGNRGGGGELIEAALHYAFRSEEGTCKKTMLESDIPRLFGYNRISEIAEVVWNELLSKEQLYQIPITVVEAASKGDEIAQNLIIEMGSALGEIAGGVIVQLNLEKEKVPIALIGSLFRSRTPLLLDAYALEVHKVAPLAYFVISEVEPVIGAYRLALDHIS